MWQSDVITHIPASYPGILEHSIIGKALENKIWSLNVHDISDYGCGKHKTVDDSPTGGGAGMVMRPDVALSALDKITNNDIEERPILYPSPAGVIFDQKMAKYLAKKSGCIFLCGRFEGVDQRLFEKRKILEVSMGDFILCGGDVAAHAIMESVIRLLDGVLGNSQSLNTESFENILLEHPQYTKPRNWEGINVPDVLLSGDHQKINDWRQEQSKIRTKERRPDLWKKYCRIYDE